MIDVVAERWSTTGNRVDLTLSITNWFGTELYQLKTHIVGQGLKEHDAKEMAETMIEMVDSESYNTGKRSLIFPMRSQYNATGYVTNNNIPEAWQNNE